MSTYQEHCAPSVEPNSNLDHPGQGRMRRGLVLAAVGLVVSFGVAANAGAADTDCTVNLHITNGKSTAIKVVSIVYDPHRKGGKEETERLDNKKLSGGESDDWKTVRLQHAAIHDPIARFRIEYRNDTSGQGKPSSPWGEVKQTVYLDNNGEGYGDCRDGKTYNLVVP